MNDLERNKAIETIVESEVDRFSLIEIIQNYRILRKMELESLPTKMLIDEASYLYER